MPPLRPLLAAAAVLAVVLAPVGPAAAAPPLDVPAPFFWDAQTQQRVGADALRFEVDGTRTGLSTWYLLSYLDGGDRLRVHDHSPAGTLGAGSAIARSANVAWHVAGVALGRRAGIARDDELPSWARARTGGVDGPSAGLLFALADVDLLTPGRLAGDLRVAATGAIGSDGVVTAVRMVDAKVAAARLAGADVVFAPDFAGVGDAITAVAAPHGSLGAAPTIGDWLDTAGYERAGRRAPPHALVPVDDVRQALAWLCGRTGRAATCAIAHAAAAVPPAAARPYQLPAPQEVAPGSAR